MNERIFKQIYKEYSIKLYNFILWTTSNRAASQDILQHVFINVWKQECVPSDQAGCQRWLYAIARNACLDYFRKSTRFAHFRARYSREVPEYYMDSDERFTWRELENLPESDKSILYLHLKNGYTYKEIGEMMDISENNVRIKAFRALKRLRERMTKEV